MSGLTSNDGSVTDADPTRAVARAGSGRGDRRRSQTAPAAGWLDIFAVLGLGVGVALVLTLSAQFAAGFMVEDFCSSVADDPAAYREMPNPYSNRWFSGPPECYRVGANGTVLAATDRALAWKLFVGTVVLPTLAGLTVSAIGFRLLVRRRTR